VLPLFPAVALTAGNPPGAYAHTTGPIIAERKPAMTILLPADQEIQLALSAGPGHMRSGAALYVFGRHGYQLVRSGTNGFTCLVNRDDNQAGDHDLKPTCWDPEGTRTIVPVMLRVGELIANAATAGDIQKDIEDGYVRVTRTFQGAKSCHPLCKNGP
jgi:hypothetical protein